MNLIIGSIIVIGSVLGGFAALGGNLGVLWQPFEVLIICGGAVGAFVIANPSQVRKDTVSALRELFRGTRHKHADYLELLGLLYTVLRMARTKGLLSLEKDIERPEESQIFQQFPTVLRHERAVRFLTDYLRLMSLGADRSHEMEALMDEELSTLQKELQRVSHALHVVAEGLPALGIVAAVLGMIKAMGSIAAPPEVLGHMIGGALVGTFMGVLLSYGFIGPLAGAAHRMRDEELKYFQCMKAGLTAYLHGSAPAICVEHARKVLYSEVQPSFYDVEEVTTAAAARLTERQKAA
ncbi:flagellar motor stator protein MotA [Rhodocista pekingensis]|uniref:Flagellar motor stator protein MotA n=1 Tax=Rhodocista pekingensis TaxID=201185 RepID=A0ABW2KYV2_9PROT